MGNDISFGAKLALIIIASVMATISGGLLSVLRTFLRNREAEELERLKHEQRQEKRILRLEYRVGIKSPDDLSVS